MPDIYLDEQIKIEYDPVTLTELFRLNAVGPCGWIDIDEVVTGYDASEYNHVNSSTGSDSIGDGTASIPYATEIKAIDSCTVDKPYVLIQDSGEYSGDYTVLDNEYYQGSFAASGETPKRCLRYIETELTDTNCVFVDSDTGDDGNAGTEAAPKATLDGAAGAFSVITASKQEIEILNSGTYNITELEWPESLSGIHSALGKTPIISLPGNNYVVNNLISSQSLPISATNLSNELFGNSEALPNGNYIVAYKKAWSYGGNYNNCEFVIYDKNSNVVAGPIEYAPAVIYANGSPYTVYRNACVAHIDDKNILLMYSEFNNHTSTPLYWYGRVLNTETMTMGDRFTIRAAGHEIYAKATGLDSGEIALAISLESYLYLYILDPESNYNIVRSATFTLTGSNVVFGTISKGPGGLLYISSGGNDNGSGVNIYCLMAVSVDTLEIVMPGTVITTSTSGSAYFEALIQPDGNIFCHAIKNKARYYFILSSEDITNIIKSDTYIDGHYSLSQGGCVLQCGKVVIFRRYEEGTTGEYMNVYLPHITALLINNELTLDGLTVRAVKNTYLFRMLDAGSAKCILKWCSIDTAYSDTDGILCTALLSSGEVELYNTLIIDADIGADITAAKVKVYNSIFARITAGYAITIDGAAASEGDILIKNCTIFSNGGGIKLENNHGDNETLEGLILHDNADTGITAETEVTLTRSVSTDTLTNVALSNVIQSNPAFVNEGYINPDNMNLDLMSKLLGYLRTSPAIGLCSDSKNAGAYDVLYVGVGVNWSSITVRKPEVIPIQRIYAGAVNLQLANGDYDSYHEGRSEKIELKFQGVENDEYDDLDKIMSCVKNSLKVYFAPTTRPDEYFAFKLLRETINAGNSFYILDQYGKEDFSIFIARAYERTDG